MNDDNPAPRPRRGAGAILRTGAIMLGVAIALVFSPLALGAKFEYSKYPVVLGLLVGCTGVSVMIHGVLDRLKDRR